ADRAGGDPRHRPARRHLAARAMSGGPGRTGKGSAMAKLHPLFAGHRLLPSFLLAALICPAVADAVEAQSAGASQAPFGDTVGPRIPFYDRAAPQVATAGPLDQLGVIEAKGVG